MNARHRVPLLAWVVLGLAALGTWLWRAHDAGDRVVVAADAGVSPMRPGWRPEEPALPIPAPAAARAGIGVDDAELEAALAAWRPHLECLRMRGFVRRSRWVQEAAEAAARGDVERAAAFESDIARYDACDVADVEAVMADLQGLEAAGAAGRREARFAFAHGLGELARDRRWRSEVTPWLIAKAGIAQGWMEAEAAGGDPGAMGWLAEQMNPGKVGPLLDTDRVASEAYALASQIPRSGDRLEDALERVVRRRASLGLEPYTPDELEQIRARTRALLDAQGG